MGWEYSNPLLALFTKPYYTKIITMVNILPIASGKGGVGKSAVSVNVAVSLAQKGKKVILCDFDFGGANLHTLLGLKNNQAGMGNFIYRQIADLGSILQETGIENLQFIAGDCLFPGTANMDFFHEEKNHEGFNHTSCRLRYPRPWRRKQLQHLGLFPAHL